MVYTKEDPTSIQEMFNSIAQNYDRGNALLSFQMHRRWNQQLINHVLVPESNNLTLLDLCCGTGDIAFAFLQNQPKTSHAVYMLDFSTQMLACARQKAEKLQLAQSNITYLEADAQEIPLPSGSIDRVTIAYGIRNVQNRDRCFAEIKRVLRPGGMVGILELTRPKNKILRLGHQAYLKTILPFLGRCVTDNEEAYRYLCNSIKNFVTPQELATQLCCSGFQQPTCIPLSGGIATIIIAKST